MGYIYFHPPHHPHGHGCGGEAGSSVGRGCPVAGRLALAHLARCTHSRTPTCALLAAGAICFATAMGAFGTAFTLATRIDVLPMIIYTEFTLQANIAMAAALSFRPGPADLGSSGVCSNPHRQQRCRRRMTQSQNTSVSNAARARRTPLCLGRYSRSRCAWQLS